GAAPVPPGPTGARRAGVGPEVPVLELPHSHDLARKALRFTAEGTEADPGPRIVHAEELGGLILLADLAGPGTPPVPDVLALEAAAAQAPWAVATFQAVAFAPSLRAAATELNLHHSTLQERLGRAERWLGWTVHDPRGRLRLQVALALRRLHRGGPREGQGA
ncbi:helix-turn-helix domain-containing protein, partial [Actinocorallia longicatena]|uniref:helix-turn-helix domain-containing protein n=1 Tax=Actinocorallia longicatena TaxID=111803 RepID=UPI0031DB280C